MAQDHMLAELTWITTETGAHFVILASLSMWVTWYADSLATHEPLLPHVVTRLAKGIARSGFMMLNAMEVKAVLLNAIPSSELQIYVLRNTTLQALFVKTPT